jgi:rhodanese-related sulfurtransferase
MVRPASSRGLARRRPGYVRGVAEDGESLGVKDARREIASGEATAVDVRDQDEWSEGHVPGAIHLPEGDPDAATKPLEEGARLMVIADDDKHAGEAAKDLGKRGYDAVAVKGGMKDWVSEDFPIQPTPDPDEDTELGLG